MVWWQLCLLELFKGISWSLPILAIFLGMSMFVNYLTADIPEKVRKWRKGSTEESE